MVNTAEVIGVIVLGTLLIVSADTDHGTGVDNTDDELLNGENVTVLTTSDDAFSPRTATQNDVEATRESELPDNENSKGIQTTTLKPKGKKKKNKVRKPKTASNETSTTKMPRLAKNIKIDEKDEIEREEESSRICDAPPDIEGAMTPRTVGTKLEVGKSITYSCHFGYVSRNSMNHISTCIVDESTGRTKWTVPEIACMPQSCGDPGFVNNGRRIGNLFTFPNAVEYECDEGYKLSGLRTRYCQAGGQWSGKLPTCEVTYCSAPTDPLNGFARYSSLEYGSELRYACHKGFSLNEDVTRYCTAEGDWSDVEPMCTEARCNRPLDPDHGSVRLSGEPKVGSLATYTCDPGRFLVGMSTVKCLITGQWTFDPPECLRDCKVPYVENGEIGQFEVKVIKQGSYNVFKKFQSGKEVKPREVLTLRCKAGYSPVEDSTVLNRNDVEVECRDGTWSKELLCKQILCYTNQLNNPGLKTPSQESFRNYEKFEISCEIGFKKVTRKIYATCDNGRWDLTQNDLPCSKDSSSCDGDPPKVENGKAVIHHRHHGYTIWYDCYNKNMVKVPGHVSCQSGSWVGNPPKCLSNPCDTNKLDYPGLKKPTEDQYFPSKESFDVQCEEGYTVSNPEKKITCTKGEWSITENPCSEVRCYSNQLKYPGLQKPQQEIFRHLETFNISCEMGFQKVTRATHATCYDGLWDLTEEDLPCAKDRAGLVAEVSTPQPTRTSTENQPRQIVTFSSRDVASSSHAEECFCTLDYEENFLIIQAGGRELKKGDKVKRGETISLSCKDYDRALTWPNGLRLYGNANLTCNACQNWFRQDHPYCRRHSYSEGQPLIHYDSKLEITPSGVSKLRKMQDLRLLCSSTKSYPHWFSPGDFHRDKQNYFVVNHPNIGATLYYTYIDITQTDERNNGKYECSLPLSSHKNSTLELEVIEITCPLFLPMNGLNVSYTKGNKVGSFANFFCPIYAQLVGNENSVCESTGYWSLPQPHCEDYVTCSKFPDTSNVEIYYTKNVSVGSEAFFTCSPPNVLVGSSAAVCLNNGTWNNPLPVCEEPKCSIGTLSVLVPEDIVPVIVGGNGFVPIGSQVELDCENNKVIIGNSMASCVNKGKWEFGTPVCEMGCRLNLDPSSLLVVDQKKTGYRFGENVLLSCPPGTKMTSDVERLVCLYGWSDAFPKCVNSTEG